MRAGPWLAAGITALALCASAAAATGPAGRASVIDGDTLEIHGERIRLWGIDAPESGQTCRDRNGAPWRCGQRAALTLATLVDGAVVRCTLRGRDVYRRAVARCDARGRDLGAALVSGGWALDFRRYSRGAYAAEERDARDRGRGIWAGAFEPPWAWRRSRRAG